MDGFSVAASVIAVLQLSNEVVKYLRDATNAPKDCQQCVSEASNLNSLLINLLYHLDQKKADDTWYTAVRALNVDNGPLDQYKQCLILLQSKIENKDGLHKLKRRLFWKFSREETTTVLTRIERLKTLVNTALEMDHMKLSRAIKDDTATIQADLITLQSSTAANEARINQLCSDTHRVQDDTSCIRNAFPVLQASTTAVRDAQTQQHYQSAMEWLSPTNFPAQQHDIISRKAEGTGQSFLNSPKFQNWLQGPDRILFCPGIPGAGKTMMAAAVIEHLYQTIYRDDIGIACLFCNYKAKLYQNVPNLLAAILKQLIQGRPDTVASVVHMYETHSKRESQPSVQEILQTLSSLFSRLSTVYIVIDALDECSSTANVGRQLMNEMRDLQARINVRLLFTSRFIPDVIRDFQSCPQLEIRAQQGDVKRFVAGQLFRLPACIQRDDQLKNVVQTKIVEAADGMFLLARLHVDSLLDKRTKYKALSTLHNLSKGSSALDDAYRDAITRIEGQLDEDRSLAKRAICWVSYAQRLLTTKELCCALAVELGDKNLNIDNIPDVNEVISLCAGLVTIDNESDIVRLTHYTTQEYFERVRLEWDPSAQDGIATVCLTYLSFDIFQSGSCRCYWSFRQRLSENPFFDYLAQYWSEHIRPVQRSDIISELSLAFLRNDALTRSAGQVMWQHFRCGSHNYFQPQINGLHLTAWYGLSDLTERLLNESHGDVNIDVNAKTKSGQTPLLWAACHGHETVVKLLLETENVNIDWKDRKGRTSLREAASHGYKRVVELLVERGADINSKDEHDRTPLWVAGRYGHEEVVELLLERGADVDSKDEHNQTPLWGAARHGHEGVVKLLLERGADINSKDVYSWTLLQVAEANGQKSVVKMLLERDAEVESKDMNRWMPIGEAIGTTR